MIRKKVAFRRGRLGTRRDKQLEDQLNLKRGSLSPSYKTYGMKPASLSPATEFQGRDGQRTESWNGRRQNFVPEHKGIKEKSPKSKGVTTTFIGKHLNLSRLTLI